MTHLIFPENSLLGLLADLQDIQKSLLIELERLCDMPTLRVVAVTGQIHKSRPRQSFLPDNRSHFNRQLDERGNLLWGSRNAR